MIRDALPIWMMLPFAVLVVSVAALPIVAPYLWTKRGFQALVVFVCAAPVVIGLCARGASHDLVHALSGYASFICTLAALYVTTGGIFAAGNLEGTPRVNVTFLLIGSLLASVIGTTGASVLLIRPFLRTNAARENTQHLVPFFILTVANAGGLLTPLGDPPLLVGFIHGVPFFWTLRLFPAWALYVGFLSLAFYVIDRRAYALERESAKRAEHDRVLNLQFRGSVNLCWLVAIVLAAFLPNGARELALIAIGLGSYVSTSREIRELNDFSFAPIVEVAILFAGFFACLVPVERDFVAYAEYMPVRSSAELFWVAGMLSSVLDNAPTYAAFTALARGLSLGRPALVNGIEPLKLVAISVGSVVMGATTYIANGPNLMVKAIAERADYVLPSFLRYAAFALLAMLIPHLVMTLAFVLLER